MKLADEIAEAVYREQGAIRDGFGPGVELSVAAAVGIIAAKLEPIREALMRIANFDHADDCDCKACSALAMLSEEE